MRDKDTVAGAGQETSARPESALSTEHRPWAWALVCRLTLRSLDPRPLGPIRPASWASERPRASQTQARQTLSKGRRRLHCTPGRVDSLWGPRTCSCTDGKTEPQRRDPTHPCRPLDPRAPSGRLTAGPRHRRAGRWDSPARCVHLRSPLAPGLRTVPRATPHASLWGEARARFPKAKRTRDEEWAGPPSP